MKKYTTPEIKIAKFDSEDILTTSGGLNLNKTAPTHNGKAVLFDLSIK